MPCRIFISIGTASETCAPASLTPLPAEVGHPGHVDEQIVGSEPDVVVDAALAPGEQVQDRTDPERREDVRRNLEIRVGVRWSRTCV